MGYDVEGDVITGPDSYKFRVIKQEDEVRINFRPANGVSHKC